MTSKSAIILRNKTDIKILAQANIVADIIVYNAGIEFYLDDFPVKGELIIKPYDNSKHKQTSEMVTKILSEFPAQMLKKGFSPIVTEELRGKLFYIINASSYISGSLSGYDKYYWVENGQIISGDFNQIYSIFFAQVMASKSYEKPQYIGYLRKFLIKRYNDYVSKQLASKKKLLMADGGRASSRNFAKAIRNVDENVVVLLAKNSHKNFLSTVRQIVRSLASLETNKFEGKDVPVFFFYSEKKRASGLRKIISQYPELKLAEDYLISLASEAIGFEEMVPQQIAQLKPDIVAVDAIASAFQMVTCREAKNAGARVVFFNHGAVSYQAEGISKQVTDLWSSLGRVYSPYATHHVARAPGVFKILQDKHDLVPDSKLVPLRFEDKPIEKHKNEKFRILFAGNFLNPNVHVPWIMETPAEFMQGIFSLAEAVSKLPQAELVIRVKPSKTDTGEIDFELMKHELAKYPNVKFDQNPSFMQTLAETDLMVASITTTIDQALTANIPVLLHSGGMRYQYYPAMTEIPSDQKRSAVYATMPQIKIEDLLAGIIKSHQTPLNTEELAPYAWGGDVRDMKSLASEVL